MMKIQCAVVLVLGAIAASGCGAADAPKARRPARAAQAAPFGPVEIDAAAVKVLAEADALDGPPDHVVHRCLMCGLFMDGFAEHASAVGQYTLHHCGPGCKEAFDRDPLRFIRLVRIPLPNPVYPEPGGTKG